MPGVFTLEAALFDSSGVQSDIFAMFTTFPTWVQQDTSAARRSTLLRPGGRAPVRKYNKFDLT
jgi:hypothetical protein